MLFPYFLSLLGLICNSVFFPHIHLFVFAPFLALLVIRKNLLSTLWIAAWAGLTLDLLSSNIRFGLYAVSFLATGLVIFKLKNLFYEEKPLALAVFSSMVAFIFTLIELFLISSFGRPPPFTFKALSFDLLILPLVDGIFSFFWFSLPLKLYTWLHSGKFFLLFKTFRNRRRFLKRGS